MQADSIGSALEQFMAYFQSLVLVSERAESRQRPLQHHLEHFRQWIGGSEQLSSVNGAMFTRYHAYLLQQVPRIAESVGPIRVHDAAVVSRPTSHGAPGVTRAGRINARR